MIADQDLTEYFYRKIGLMSKDFFETVKERGYDRFDKIIPIEISGLEGRYFLARFCNNNKKYAIVYDEGLIISEAYLKNNFDFFEKGKEIKFSQDSVLKSVANYVASRPMLLTYLPCELFDNDEFIKYFNEKHSEILFRKSKEIQNLELLERFDNSAKTALEYLDETFKNKKIIAKVMKKKKMKETDKISNNNNNASLQKNDFLG